jgi:hypothetical protein
LHYAGRVNVHFVSGQGSIKLAELKPLIDHEAQTVTSSTGELKLDYGKGVLTLNAPRAQGISGFLQAAGRVETADLIIESPMELGHVVAVPLDGQPLAKSGRILLQVMSEEKASGFATEQAGPGTKRITNIGTDPWVVKNLEGTVQFKRPDAGKLRVTALDFNGYPDKMVSDAHSVRLQPRTVYYLVSE